MYATQEEKSTPSWLDRPLITAITVNWETVLFSLLLIVTLFTRFYLLEPRVMSHDENSHVYYSWLLYRGQGYTHDPITHGPFQFHVVALSYFLFGDSDTSARIPVVLFSIATVAFMWYYRRYLGRAGALVAALLFLISPYMLYYGRYVRNEAFVALFGVITLWAILRYLETGAHRYLYYLTAVTAFHFITKETSFIYTAQALIFLAFFLVYQVVQKPWKDPEQRNRFLYVFLAGLLLLALAGGLLFAGPQAPAIPEGGETPVPEAQTGLLDGLRPVAMVLGALGAVALLAAAFLLLRGYTWAGLRSERSFDMLVVLGTMVLPMLAPFPVKLLNIVPVDFSNAQSYSDPQSITIVAIFVGILSLLAIALGILWKPRLWLLNAALFYAIFTVFYTTLFTNGFGFISGLVGSLGYWLEQQGVNRGSQPWYYYAFLQVPIYEFLPALGAILGFVLMALGRQSPSVRAYREAGEAAAEAAEATDAPRWQWPPVLALLAFWSATSLLAYTVAGEKMPWLTVHIALPLILMAGWAIGYLIETTDWQALRRRRGWLAALLIPVFLISFAASLGSLLGLQPPFQGSSLEQLRATTTFVSALIVAIASAAGLYTLVKDWEGALVNRLVALFVVGFLALTTARSAFRAAYINYDLAKEFLVYAHSAPGVKVALEQIEELSRRTTDSLAIEVAYDNETTYPYWWYLRNYTNTRYYGENPTRSLRDAPVILVGNDNYGKIEAVVGQAYQQFDYIRLWWPIQDYYGLTWERIVNAVRNPEMRSALFQIWFNRDYELYAQATGQDLSLPSWNPADRMRLYIRKDVVTELWNYGSVPAPEEVVADPYEGGERDLAADRIIGTTGAEPGQFQRPRGIATAPDGSLYVADTANHRIQHLNPQGEVLRVWGSFADATAGDAPGGTFNEPWNLTVGPDGFVYVADTWNHRIQKFTSEGEFVTMWGFFGQAETPYALWGPRDVAVDSQGRVFVTDTGNKRVVVYDSQGNAVTEFGGAGLALGEFDEPVGIAAGPDDRIYVNDTWNQRIQVFREQDGAFVPETSWDVVAWYGQSLENKPYIAVGEYVFITDPESSRVIQFTREGEFVQFWGDYGSGANAFDLVSGVAVGEDGGLWVTDPGNGRVMFFQPPPPAESAGEEQ